MSSSKKRDYMKVISMTECNICHLELSDPRRIECGHIFCFHCLGNHVRSSPSCPTCERPMKPKLGKVDSYPVAMEIIHLLQSLHKVESCGKIVDDEDDENVEHYEDIDSDKMQMTTTATPKKPQRLLSEEVCECHEQPLVSVCTTCDDELICAKCSFHSTHNKQDISEHNQYLSNLLSKQKDKLLQRVEDVEAVEEKLQEMIEKQINQKDTIKDEIEEIAEEMFAQIHRKKEEMLHPIEDETDEFVKHLSNRQEQIKDQKSNFNYIRSKMCNLSIDNPLDYSRKAKRLVKQANIALQIENKPVPHYQNIGFTRNDTVLEDLSQLQLGDVKIDEVSIAQDEDGKASDFISDEEEVYMSDVYTDDLYTYDDAISPPPPPVRPNPENSYDLLPTPMEGKASDFISDEEDDYEMTPLANQNDEVYVDSIMNDVYTDDVYTYDDSILPRPPPVRPKPEKSDFMYYEEYQNMSMEMTPLSDYPLPTPMAQPTMDPQLPPRPQKQYQNQNPPSAKNEEQIYHDVGDSLYNDTMRKQKHDTEPPEQKEDKLDGHFNPPPLSPFSGTFRKSVSIAIDNRAFPQRLLHRVFLPFRPSGFTVVRGSMGHYFSFVTNDNYVKMFRQNGDIYRTITDLVQPFDAASQQHGEALTLLYITDEGRRTGDGSVRVYTSEGEFQKVLVGKLKKPQGISISRVGLVYVCDEANILVFCPKTGKRKRIISTIGKDPIFVRPLYVIVSATGKILVSDVGTRELKIHDETRKYTDKFKPDEDEGELYTSFTPGMCAEDSSSNYYVIDHERNILYILRGGGRSEKLALPQKPQGHHGIPTAVSFASDTGNIVVF